MPNLDDYTPEGGAAAGHVQPARYIRFADDCRRAGLAVQLYHGRLFYIGPAVTTREAEGISLQMVIRATDVKVQWDHMGKADHVVYPA